MRPQQPQVRRGRWAGRQWLPGALPAAGGRAEGAWYTALLPMWPSLELVLDCGGGLEVGPRVGPGTRLPGRTSAELAGAGRLAVQGCWQPLHTP